MLLSCVSAPHIQLSLCLFCRTCALNQSNPAESQLSSGADVHLSFIIAPSLACHHVWPTVSWLNTERSRKTESLHHLCSVVSNTIHSSPVTRNRNWNPSDKIFWPTSLLAHRQSFATSSGHYTTLQTVHSYWICASITANFSGGKLLCNINIYLLASQTKSCAANWCCCLFYLLTDAAVWSSGSNL